LVPTSVKPIALRVDHDLRDDSRDLAAFVLKLHALLLIANPPRGAGSQPLYRSHFTDSFADRSAILL